MKNVVIKVLNKEHGKKVIEYFKSIGVNTGGSVGYVTEKDGNTYIYYGILNGHISFSNYCYSDVKHTNTKIIELPINIMEIKPTKMAVSNDGENWLERYIVGKIGNKFLCFWGQDKPNLDSLSFYYWKYAKPIETKVELTMQEIADKFEIPVGDLKIKK